MHSRTVQGTPISPGMAVGPVHIVRAGSRGVPTWTVAREEVPGEIGRLADAVNAAAELLAERQRRVAQTASEKDAEIFAVHRMILQDPVALREVEQAISEERINAEAAVQRLIERFEATMGNDPTSSFAADVSDPWRFVLDVLLERDREEIQHSQDRVVLAAEELTPKVVTFLDRGRVLAVIAEAGGRFSHGAVLARSFGLPCVVGLPNVLARLEQNMIVAVDGDSGVVQLRPEQESIARILEEKRSRESRREELRAESAHPATTTDGERLGVTVNMESIQDLDTFEIGHTDGVGLLRTEFLYMERSEFPSEEEQYRLYRRILEGLGDKPATFRLLDIGGDKPLPYFQTPKEVNPALGWRGLRITLQWRDLMRVQLRALLRASIHGRLRVLLPMVTSIEEVEDVHRQFVELRSELLGHGYEIAADVPVGTMVEVPSTLFDLDRLARSVDFLSVGTNDLVQYLLAVDRDNPWVSRLYDPLHPAVIRALAMVAKAAREAGKPVSVCGDMASDAMTAILLLGLGYESVSVPPQYVPEIKYAVRRVSARQARDWARRALSERNGEGVRGLLGEARRRLYRESGSPQAG